ncbi:PREDICTED: gamma-aminobutyric acid receptor subunit beta-3-like [Branchiostoma belcheri]|uniref:Gamma-aminobutyric acid receptor subunit beta-3-like n=1 Tax=Branchiostoma belcheri TaxID=7741 RepID=A0A6P5ADN9_BRABE|nr:PREDICTED: gamma-aminobutyric acid receptor subunit beta-3-like [Branchiostoma belcheri]
MTIASIDQISEVNMDYTITIFLRQYWQDQRLAFSGTNKSLSLDGRLADNLWVPDTFIPNAKESFLHKVTVDNRLIRLYPDGRIIYGLRITAKAECDMDLRKYPMDEQNCTLEFESYGYNFHDMVYLWRRGKSSISGLTTLKLQQFNVGSFNVHSSFARYETGDFPKIVFSFEIQRQAFYFILQTYIPSILLVVLSWVSFWINPDAVPARVALGITTVLTMTTLITGARQALPKISYIKAIDVYLVICFLFSFAALLEYAVVNFQSSRIAAAIKREKEKDKDGLQEIKVDKMGKTWDSGCNPSELEPLGNGGGNLQPLTVCNQVSTNSNKAAELGDVRINSLNIDDCREKSGEVADDDMKKSTSIGDQIAVVVRRLSDVTRMVQVSTIDNCARFAFPAMFAVFNIVYFMYYCM